MHVYTIFQSEFTIGLMFEGFPFYTNPIPLSEEEVELQLYRPDKGKILFIDGYLQTRILIKHPQENKVSSQDLFNFNNIQSILFISNKMGLVKNFEIYEYSRYQG